MRAILDLRIDHLHAELSAKAILGTVEIDGKTLLAILERLKALEASRCTTAQ